MHAIDMIKSWIGRRDLNRSELARRLGVSHTWVRNRLAGSQEITLEELVRIARALDIEVAELLPKPPPERAINARYGRVPGRPRSAAKLHARNSTPRPTATSAERQPVAVAAGTDSGPRSRPFWRHA